MTRRRASLVNFSLALLSALLLIFSFPNQLFPHFAMPWLAPIALTPIVLALGREPRPLFRFLLGEFAGIVYWFGICSWIQFVLEVHGGMGRWGGWATFLLFAVAKAIHMAVFSLFAAVLVDTSFAVPAIAALWTGIERTHADFGFAWLALGNAGIDMPLPLRLAPLTGVYGLSFILAITAVTLAVIIRRRDRRQLYWLTMALGLYLLPELPAPETGNTRAVMLQPNMQEDQQWTPESSARVRDEVVSRTLDAATGSGAELVLWPEVPGPIYFYQDPAFREEAATIARRSGAYFLFGTVGETPQGAPLNSAVMLTPAGEFENRYDKINLVPFGEYIPPFFGFVNRITQEISDFVPGNRIVVFPVAGHKLGAFICYESAFPHDVRRFVNDGAEVLVNLSNDGYFGHSAAREQHLEIARMRAAENGRWLLRPTNDGISAVVDPAGRLIQRLPMYQETEAIASFQYRAEKTFYTGHGDWFAWTCLIGSAAALLWSQRPHYTPPIRA